MRYLIVGGTLFFLLSMTLTAQPDLTVKIPLNGQTFTLPAGFTIEVAAKAPLVERPITIAFDERGRLYVGDSSGSNEPVAAQLAKKPHRIVRLEDTDGNGVFDASKVFADAMMFPEGTMWHRGSLFVAAPPSIWKLTDTDGDGVADQRTEWFKGKTLTGCANDLHGPYLGPDGWFYWCKGAFAEQTYEIAGKTLKTRAAHIFRARPDGSGLEPVIAGGMDNPVDLAFLPGGEMIFTSTFIQYPANGRRDGLLHGVQGGLYGKEFLDVIGPHTWTSPKVMPVMDHLGPAAPSGLTVYESAVFGKRFQGNAFVCQFNLQKVTRHILTPEGATFRSESSDFVVSDNKDFHPTDVIEDADGSLLIVDTGGWYKLCCPSSHLVKADVLGAIYRVRKTGAKPPDDPRGAKIDWRNVAYPQIANLLGDPRPAVRERAKETLADRGPLALTALETVLRKDALPLSRREAVWTLIRIDLPEARRLVRAALNDDDAAVRQTALHGISRNRDADAASALIEIVAGQDPQNQRAAAEALGRITISDKLRDPAIAALMNALARPHDAALHHSLVYALIEMNVPADVLLAQSSTAPGVRRATLMALEHSRDLARRSHIALDALTHADAEVRATAWWIAARHPEWGEPLARFLDQLFASEISADDRDDLVKNLAKLARSPAIGDLLARQASDAAAKRPARKLALAAMVEANLKAAPVPWLHALGKALETPELIPAALAAARRLRLLDDAPPVLLARLETLGEQAEQAPSIRLGALAALPAKNRTLSAKSFTFVCEQLQANQPTEGRGLAVEVLSRRQLTNEQLGQIADSLPAAGPLEIVRLLELFGGVKDDALGARLLDSLEKPALRPALRADAIERRFKSFGASLQKRAQTLGESLNVDAAAQRARLETLLAELPVGDLRRGHAVFYSAKASCIACHTIGYVGGKTGPDLTRIGQIRSRRDLLEAVLFPSASFARGYEPILIVTNDGKTHNGIIKAQTPDEIILTTGLNQDVRIARTAIEDMQPSRVSVMAAGLEQQLSRNDLADLLAFLQACR